MARSQKELDQIITKIKDDCRVFGVEESRISGLERVWTTHIHTMGKYLFYYDMRKGYVLSLWFGGRCTWEMFSPDELGFRFLFQRYIILEDFRSIPDAERFMSCAFSLFGSTQEYKDAEKWLDQKKEAAARKRQEQEKMEHIIPLIREDCRAFGIKDDTYVEDVLGAYGHSEGCGDGWKLFYDVDQGCYVLINMDRGYIAWEMISSDELGFRFLFQRHIILADFRSIPDAERFMACASALFGSTQEYRDAEKWLEQKKEAAARKKE